MFSFTSKLVRKACFSSNKNVFPAINFNVRHQHEKTAVVNKSTQQETKVDTNPTKRKRRPESYFVRPSVSKATLKDLNVISSLVITTNEIAMVKMNKDLTVTEITSEPFVKMSLNNAYQYIKTVYPIMEKCNDSDLLIMEHNLLPQTYNFINSHIRNIKFLFSGRFDTNENRKIYQISRINTARLFGLQLGFDRICGKDVAERIFKSGMWNDKKVVVPEELLTETVHDNEAERTFRKKLPSSTTDAFLQALAFWDFHEKRLMNDAT